MSKKCPYCDGTLQSGEAKIHGTLTGFLLVGLSHQNLYFKNESGEESEILGCNESTPAMKCDMCGVVTLNINFPKQNWRDKMVEILTLCAFDELRDNIQTANIDANINNEITAKWNASYLPHDSEFKSFFVSGELSQLEHFDKLIKEQNWAKIENKAEEIIGEINSY